MTCGVCGEAFEPRANKRYCSNRHKVQAQHRRVQARRRRWRTGAMLGRCCAHCGRPLAEGLSTTGPLRKWCDERCKHRAYRKRKKLQLLREVRALIIRAA
jgi:hypothetical protein